MNTVVITEPEIHILTVGEQGPPGPPGVGGSSTTEIVSVYNAGDPQIVFTKTGDVVTNDVA